MTNRPDDSTVVLRETANRWALKARDHARESKAQDDPKAAAYHRGIAETYHKLAMELAALVKNAQAAASTAPTDPVPPAGMPAAAPPPPQYAETPLREVLVLLEYAGTPARDVTPHKDNAFTAVFSRWQPFSEAERLAKIRAADPRIIILANGKVRDTGDPYIDFAFKEFES